MRPTSVYLAFDAFGDLLYVGHTEMTVEQRMSRHRYSSPWAVNVSEVHFTDLDSYPDALQLERELITELQPLHNVMNNPRHGRGAA